MTRSARMVRRRSWRRAAALAAATALAALSLAVTAPAGRASAHDYLVDSSPAAGSTVTSPIDEVSLTFNDVVLNLSKSGNSSIVQVTDASGAHFETGCPTTAGRVVTVPVALGASGKYTVTWQIVSADGHTVSAHLEFSYEVPSESGQAHGTSRSACARAAQAESDTGQADASDGGTQANAPAQNVNQRGEAETSTVLGIVGIIFALVVIGVAVILFTARRRPRRGAPPEDED